MTRKNKIVSVAAAAMGGLLAGSAALAGTQCVPSLGLNASASRMISVKGIDGVKAVALDDSTTQPAKHDCKGMNDCKGQGGCKSSDNGCKGKNSCKGKGGCSSNMSGSATTQPSGSGM